VPPLKFIRLLALPALVALSAASRDTSGVGIRGLFFTATKIEKKTLFTSTLENLKDLREIFRHSVDTV